MIRVRHAAERGHFDHGWLDTYHTFSFADYHDAAHMGFRALRVINEDRVAPGAGFGMHGHRDMEIVTLILSGALEHRDSLGNGAILRPGELQHMTAGTGVRHSEFNPSTTEAVHLYQIWLLPERNGLAPSYDQKAFAQGDSQGKFLLVAAPDGRNGALTIRQDADLWLTRVDDGQTVTHLLNQGRSAWLQVLRGSIELNGVTLNVGDGAAVVDETALTVGSTTTGEVLLFDLA